MSLKAISERLGWTTGGASWVDTTKAVKILDRLGFVTVVEKRVVRRNFREKIAGDLHAYQATAAEVAAVYQGVLFEIATEGA